MTEHTDKAPEKSGKKRPAKRSGGARAPRGKRTKTPGGKAAASPAAATGSFDPNYPGPKAMAPDPATITFGSNRPIVAAPPKLPESSGLKFAGASAGKLKASGPQPTSPKASGLTFTAAKSGGSAKVATRPAAAPKAGAKAGSGLTKDELKTPSPAAAARPTGAMVPDAKAENAKPEAGKSDPKTGDAKKAAATKPAIAPPVAVRRFDKQRSTGGFVAMLLALTLIGGALAFWLKLGSETPPAGAAAPQQAVEQAEAPPAVPDTPHVNPDAPEVSSPPAAPEAPVHYGRSVRAPESPGPLAAAPAETAPPGLTAAEIAEIQRLLSLLDLDPGSESGVVTPETAAAIRSYQEMAGLPADGAATVTLLEELRSVADLYGN